MKDKNWSQFWNKENPEFDKIMERTTAIFYENMNVLFPIKNKDIVLDFGCGSGILIRYLKDICKKVVGVDNSTLYVEKCKESFRGTNNVSIFQISDIHTLEKILLEEKINRVIVLSVIQYFESLDYLYTFLEIFRKSVVKSALSIDVVIADIIPVKHSIIQDFFEILCDSIKNKYLFTLIIFILKYIRVSFRETNKLRLQVDYQFFENYAKMNGVNVMKIKRLTNHSNRYSVAITFS